MSDIPENLQRFISERIDSVEQLEILLLLERTQDREWSAGDLAKELGVPSESAALRLAGLEAGGLAASQAGAEGLLHRYAPVAPALRGAVWRLAEVYPIRREAFAQLIQARRP